MMYGFFLGILMYYILYKILNGIIKYCDNKPALICLILGILIYSVFLYEYIIWFSSWYSVNFLKNK